LVVIPGPAGDQPFVAAAVQEWGAGRALPGDADVATMREAARDVLADGSYRLHARERAARLADVDGAVNAAGEVEALLGSVSAGRAATE
jgi:UDP:flavonoid glycosyltransferase YjiC (YdhE family)